MSRGDAPLDSSWVAAIHASADDFSPLGAGLVIDDSRVLTCLHVLSNRRAGLWVAFPKADPPTLERRRVRQVVGEASSVIDVAVLYLEEPVPTGVRAAGLRCPKPESLPGERWWAFGFTAADPVGNPATGEVGESLGYGWIRLDADSRSLAEHGLSGSGLWCPRYEAVVGLVGQPNDRGHARALTFDWLDRQLPAEKIRVLAGWSAGDAGEVALAAWGWRLTTDPEARRHWGPRARGVAVDSERGFRFRGRRPALEQIVAWLDRPRPDRRVLVVTGSPGVGKSAVLGRVVTTADPDLRRLLPPDDDGVKATVGSVGCAVHAKGKTALEVATEIARAASAELPLQPEDSAPFVRAALEERRAPRFNVVVDALDEAHTPAEARLIVEKVVQPLVETCADVGVQVVVGSRRHDGAGDLLTTFGAAATTVDLDRPEHFALDDLTAYALASLQLVGAEREDSPYADATVAASVARRIAELADRNFLVAGLVARDHGLHDADAAPPGDLAFTTSVGSALAHFVERVSRWGPIPHELALGALAFAEVPGFNPRLWAIAIEALSGIAPTGEEVVMFARSSAASLLVECGEGPDGPVFRLFHQALNEALLARRRTVHSMAAEEAAITRALLAHGRSVGWAAAPAYLLRSLPTHAARAGLVDELLSDDGYLLRADLLRLLPVAHRATSSLARRRTRMLMLTPEVARADAPGRAALLSVTNALDGLDAEIEPIRRQRYRGRWAVTRPRIEVATLEGHTGSVLAVCALEARGRALLASGGSDDTVRIWDPASGETVAALEGHTGAVNAVCAAEVGGRTLLASGGDDGTVRLWGLGTVEAVTMLESHTGGVLSTCPFKVERRTFLASGGDDGIVRIWDPASGETVAALEGHTGAVNAVCAAEVGGRTLLASGGDDGIVRLWDLGAVEAVATLEGHTGGVLSLCALEIGDRTLLASGGDDGTVRLWDPSRGQTVATLEGHTGGVLSLCALEIGDRTLLASGGDDGTVRLWDPSRGQTVATLEGHTDWVRTVCPLQMDGRVLIASGGDDRTVRLWDPASSSGAVAAPEGHVGGVRTVCALQMDGRVLIASGGDDRTVRLWDSAGGKAVAILEGHSGEVRSVCPVGLEGRMLLASSGDDDTVRLWDPAGGETVTTLKGHEGWVRAVCALQMGGRMLLGSGGDDGTIRIWDPASGKAVATLEGHTDWIRSVCALEVEGRLLLASAGDDRTVRLWDPASGKAVATLEGHTDWIRSVCALTVEDRTLLASGGGDRTVRLWDPASGKAVATLEGHTGWVLSVCALNVEGRTLLASAGDRTVRLWDPVSGRPEGVVPVRHEAWSVTAAAGGLAVALSAGVLFLDIPAPPPHETKHLEELHRHADDAPEFFISCTGSDRAWAEWIAWELEEAGYAVVLQAWDFRPGSDFVLEMERALTHAKRVLAVLSPAYVVSPFAMAEWRAAFADDPEGRAWRLVPVRVADFQPPGLHATRTYIDLVGTDERTARAALLAGIRHERAKPRAALPFPARSAASAPRFPNPETAS